MCRRIVAVAGERETTVERVTAELLRAVGAAVLVGTCAGCATGVAGAIDDVREPDRSRDTVAGTPAPRTRVAQYDLPRSTRDVAVSGRVECVDPYGCAVMEHCMAPRQWNGPLREGPMPSVEFGEVYATERTQDAGVLCRMFVAGEARVWAFREHWKDGRLVSGETVSLAAHYPDVDSTK